MGEAGCERRGLLVRCEIELELELELELQMCFALLSDPLSNSHRYHLPPSSLSLLPPLTALLQDERKRGGEGRRENKS